MGNDYKLETFNDENGDFHIVLVGLSPELLLDYGFVLNNLETKNIFGVRFTVTEYVLSGSTEFKVKITTSQNGLKVYDHEQKLNMAFENELQHLYHSITGCFLTKQTVN